LHFVFGLLSTNSFEGFETTNPRDQLDGERSHLSWSKIGLRDEILHPHHSTVATGTIKQTRKEQGATLGVFSKGGAPLKEERFRPGDRGGLGLLGI
jgi:hypothetical protein